MVLVAELEGSGWLAIKLFCDKQLARSSLGWQIAQNGTNYTWMVEHDRLIRQHVQS